MTVVGGVPAPGRGIALQDPSLVLRASCGAGQPGTNDGQSLSMAAVHEGGRVSHNGSCKAKVLVIGLDGVPFDLLTTLYSRGLMPFLSSFSGRCYQATLQSTVPPISATAWTTVITGVNPGKHGILQFVSLRPDQRGTAGGSAQEVFPGGTSLLSAKDIPGPTLWELLTKAGKQQVVINVPMTYPPRPIDGIMITGMLTPPSASVFTFPPGLSQDLRDDDYEIDLSISEKESSFSPVKLVDRLRELVAKRQNTALKLMQTTAWDLFMVVFTSTDRLQHRFWKYLVPGSVEHDSLEALHLRAGLEQFFVELDEAISGLVIAAGPDTHVILLSDHGFGAVSERTVHRLSMMKELGLSHEGSSSGIVSLRRIVEGRLGVTPDQMRRFASSVLPRQWVSRVEAGAREEQLAAGAKGLAYSVTLHEYIGGIYLNKELLTSEGLSYETFRQEIITKLKRLADPELRIPLVAKVCTREELYEGPALGTCPDLVFWLTPTYGLSGGVGPNNVLVSQRRSDPDKQGTHRDEGILLVHGPGVKIKENAREKLVDITATILYLLDVPIPTSFDSRPILGAFDEPGWGAPRYVDELAGVAPDALEPDFSMSEQDREELVTRLRGLGYID
jgi:predicted AlkP superfamily phosphohydrolase/phosphomutase